MAALPDLDANGALTHALALVEAAAAALAEIPMDALMGVGLGEGVVRLRGVVRQLDATASALSQRFAHSGEWQFDGARSATHWLIGNCNESWDATRAIVHRGSLLPDFPSVATQWRGGAISAQHVDALGRILKRYAALRDELRALDDAVAVVAIHCEPHEFYQRLRTLCHRADPDAMDGREREHLSALHVSTLLDGFVRVDGTLDPVLGGRFLAMLESARRDVAEAGDGSITRRRPLPERNLDALARILDAAGAASGDLAMPRVTGERPTLNVTVPIDALIDKASAEVAWLERFGVPTAAITGTRARQIACDASLRPLIVDRQGQLIAMMPRVRSIHPALRRAVFMRDLHCRFTGCRARIDEVHHIGHYQSGGPTVLSNLVGLCWHHHHLVHAAGWRIEGDPGGRLLFSSARGRELTSDPPRSHNGRHAGGWGVADGSRGCGDSGPADCHQGQPRDPAAGTAGHAPDERFAPWSTGSGVRGRCHCSPAAQHPGL